MSYIDGVKLAAEQVDNYKMLDCYMQYFIPHNPFIKGTVEHQGYEDQMEELRGFYGFTR